MKLNINQDRVFSDDGSVDITVVAGDPVVIKRLLEGHRDLLYALEIMRSSWLSDKWISPTTLDTATNAIIRNTLLP